MGASSYRTPRFGDSWSQCGTCGLDVPSHRIRLTRKYGWQCTGWPGAGCYDSSSDWDTDDYVVKYPAGEGARWTAAPLTNTLLAGVGTQLGDLDPTYTYVFLDQDGSGRLWSVNFNGSVLTPEIVEEFPDTQSDALDYIEVNNEFRIYVQAGILTASTAHPADCPTPPGNCMKVCDLGDADIRVTPVGQIIYTPPGGTPGIVIPTFCIADTLVRLEDFETELCPTTVLVLRDDFETEFCPTEDLVILDDFETA